MKTEANTKWTTVSKDKIAFEIADGTNYGNKNIEKGLKRAIFGNRIAVIHCVADNEEVSRHSTQAAINIGGCKN